MSSLSFVQIRYCAFSPLCTLLGALALAITVPLSVSASRVAPSGIFNFATIRADDVRDYDFVAGHTARVSWSDLNPEPDQYAFEELNVLIDRLQDVDQKLNLEIMVFDAPEWVMDGAQTWEHFNRGTQPTPWDPVAVQAWDDFMSALASHEVMIKAQGGAVVPLADHPTLVSVNASVLGISSFRDVGSLPLVEGYSRETFLGSALTAIRSSRLAFPDKAGFVGFFGMEGDGEEGAFDGESLENAIVRTLSEEFNGEGQPTLGLFQELLSDNRPSIDSKITTVKTALDTFIMFQALTPWTAPFEGKEDQVTSGNPSTGIEWGYTNFGATFFEIYPPDLDAAVNGAVDTEGVPLIDGLRHWAEILAEAPSNDQDNDSDGVIQHITYFSSVDNVGMGAALYVPSHFNPEDGPTALVVHLHGGGGLGSISLNMRNELDARGWIGIAPDGREWGLFDLGCGWRTSAAYVDSIDPNVGPGERDIFDAITWASDNYNIDPKRIYLTGFSMGGRGTYGIGLRHPDRFAAIAPMAPAIDMYEVFVRRPEPTECKEGMVGGRPFDSGRVDTMYTITSGRFLIENAYNLPIYHAHGTLDTIANNDPSHHPFLHGGHITTDNAWNACFDGAQTLCFGHTPTLAELQARHPDGYPWAYMFTPVSHTPDPKWFGGTPVAEEDSGVEDNDNPGHLLGIYDFFERHTLVSDPTTIVYKSYTDAHRKAYWADIDIASPWTDTPGAIRASRNIETNQLSIELARVSQASFNLDLAGLAIDNTRILNINIAVLDEPVFDPALDTSSEAFEQPVLIFNADFSAIAAIDVQVNNQPLSESLIALDANELAIGPLTVDGEANLAISVTSLAQAPGAADAGEDQTVDENTVVVLSGSVNSNDIGEFSFEWRQLEGPSVTLNNGSTANPEFLAPNVDDQVTLVFELRLTNPQGLIAMDTTNVFINNVSDTEEPESQDQADDSDNSSGGGSMSWGVIGLLMLLGLPRRLRVRGIRQ